MREKGNEGEKDRDRRQRRKRKNEKEKESSKVFIEEGHCHNGCSDLVTKATEKGNELV